MTKKQLQEQIIRKRSLLCVGLDTDVSKIPPHLLKEEDPVFEFNKAVVEATQQYAVAYKPNLAFYEAGGLNGWKSLEKTINYINTRYPEIFTIADAKRGDIGNTSERYAKAFFSEMNFDSLTVAPYMGADSVKPFLKFKDKWVILLALTSNPGATDFQMSTVRNFQGKQPEMLFEKVLRISSEWGSDKNMMYVVGATHAEYLKRVRAQAPDHFLLIPGIGAQGGSMEEVMSNGMGRSGPNLLINSSRSIIYADNSEYFSTRITENAQKLQQKMSVYL